MSLRPHAAGISTGHAERAAPGERSSGSGMRSTHAQARDAALRASRGGSLNVGARGGGDSPPAAPRRPGSAAGSLRNSGGSVAEGAWQALEERMAMQVMDLQHRHDAEQADADRLLRANMNRLDSRVHSLETQGVRADRRSAELASLTQALTEEQRTLLIRLDRLEEQSKSGVGAPRSTPQVREHGISGEDALRRLGHVEREQRAVSMNLRLIVSVVEEAQHRTQARLRCFEEIVEGRLQPVEEKLQLRSPGSGGSLGAAPRRSHNGISSPRSVKPTDPAQTGPSVPLSPSRSVDGNLHVELTAAEMRATESLRAAQDLLRRCEWRAPDNVRENGRWTPERSLGGGAAGRSPTRTSLDGLDELRGSHSMEDLKQRLDQMMLADNMFAGSRKDAASLEDPNKLSQMLKAHNDAIGELRSLVGRLANNLTPRTDTIEARVEDLAQSVGDLSEKLRVTTHATAVNSIDQVVSQCRTLHPRTEAIEARLEAHAQNVNDLQDKLRGLPSLEQVTTHCRNLGPRTEAVEARVHAITGAIEELHARLLALPSREQVVSLCENGRSVPVDAAQLEDLKLRVQEVAKMSSLREVTRTVELQQASLIELRTRMADLWTRVELMPSQEEVLALRSGSQRYADHSGHIEDLRSRIEELETKAPVGPHLEQHEAVLADLRAKLHAVPTHDQVREAVRAEGASESQLAALHRKIELLHEGMNTSAALPELAAEVAGLRDQIGQLPSHAEVAETLRPHMLTNEARIMELHRKIDEVPTFEHVANVCRETFSAHDARVTDLHNKMEKLPTHEHIADHVEGTYRKTYGTHSDKLEELHSQLRELSAAQASQVSLCRPPEVESLERNLQHVSEAVTDLRQRLQEQPNHEQVSLTLAQSHENFAHEMRREHGEHVDKVQEVHRSLNENWTKFLSEVDSAHAGSLDDVRERVDRLSSEVRSMSQSSMEVIAEMRSRLQELVVENSIQTLQKACDVPELGKDSNHQMINHPPEHGLDEEMWGNMVMAPELAGEIRDLHSQCASLQELVDQRVVVSVHQVEKQLPEVESKVDRLLWEYSERFAKVEENDVRLNHALAKLGCNERRVKDCLDQVEKAPTLNQVRSMCREELQKFVEEVNFEGVSQKVDTTLAAVAELRDRLAEQASELEQFAHHVYIEDVVPSHTPLSELDTEDKVPSAVAVRNHLATEVS